MDTFSLQRVVLENYKSIASCVLSLGPLSFLVGPNGAGKSNFLDSLSFSARALRDGLELALRERGGIAEVCQRTGPPSFAVRLEFSDRGIQSGSYAFRIGRQGRGDFVVEREEFLIQVPDRPDPILGFKRVGAQVQAAWWPPQVGYSALFSQDALFLPHFRPTAPLSEAVVRQVRNALAAMTTYRIPPDAVRGVHKPGPNERLGAAGENITSVLGRLLGEGAAGERIASYLGQIVPGVGGVSVERVGLQEEVIRFQQQVLGTRQVFAADSMSDGTLRGLGILTALFQTAAGDKAPLSLVGIEDPEQALHPAASGVLRDALREASEQHQIVVTSHSPDLLDDDAIDAEAIIAVRARDGVSYLGHVDAASRSALRDHLFTAGELLRMDQLDPGPSSTDRPEIFTAEAA